MDDPRDYFISRVVQGKSFLEVGGLWGIVSEKVSVAHRFGARSLTIIDVTSPDSSLWSSFRSRMLEKGIPDCVAISGDICETSFNEIFDVVHCSGVLYHLPRRKSSRMMLVFIDCRHQVSFLCLLLMIMSEGY